MKTLTMTATIVALFIAAPAMAQYPLQPYPPKPTEAEIAAYCAIYHPTYTPFMCQYAALTTWNQEMGRTRRENAAYCDSLSQPQRTACRRQNQQMYDAASGG